MWDLDWAVARLATAVAIGLALGGLGLQQGDGVRAAMSSGMGHGPRFIVRRDCRGWSLRLYASHMPHDGESEHRKHQQAKKAEEFVCAQAGDRLGRDELEHQKQTHTYRRGRGRSNSEHMHW